MSICKFFLQGTCRFGENCKFEHQINSDHTYGGATQSVLLQKPGGGNVDTNTLVKSVVNDMSQAEKGGQWLLSTYAPFKEKAAFPGFEDMSMEEVRFQFYEAVKNGTVEQFKQNLQSILQQAAMRIKSLQNPSPEAVNMLKEIYSTAPQTAGTSLFGAAPASQSQSVFGGTGSNLFRQASPNATSVFGAPTTVSSVFGGQPAAPTSNIFASASTNSGFGTKSSSSSLFGGQNSSTSAIFGSTTPTSASVFGASNVTTQKPGIFGASTTPFGSQTSMFGGQSQGSSTSSIFGAAKSTSSFGGAPVFGSAPTSTPSVFGAQQPPAGSVFGGNIFNPSSTPSSGIFGAAVAPSNPVFGAQNPMFTDNQPMNTTSTFGAPTPAAAPVFGVSQATTVSAGSVFGAPSASVFGAAPTTTPTVFGTVETPITSTETSVFAPAAPFPSNPPAFGAFGQVPVEITAQVKEATPQGHSASIFGGLAPQNTPQSNVMVTAKFTPLPEFYSRIENLKKEDLEWFQGNDLTIANIPEEPPPFELCFKTN